MEKAEAFSFDWFCELQSKFNRIIIDLERMSGASCLIHLIGNEESCKQAEKIILDNKPFHINAEVVKVIVSDNIYYARIRSRKHLDKVIDALDVLGKRYEITSEQPPQHSYKQKLWIVREIEDGCILKATEPSPVDF